MRILQSLPNVRDARQNGTRQDPADHNPANTDIAVHMYIAINTVVIGTLSKPMRAGVITRHIR